MLDKEVGKRIRELREKQGMSREELANKVEITPKFLYEVETGKKGISVNNLYKIAVTLSTTCDYILFGIHRMDEERILKNVYGDFWKEINEEQRKSVVRVLEALLELSEKVLK